MDKSNAGVVLIMHTYSKLSFLQSQKIFFYITICNLVFLFFFFLKVDIVFAYAAGRATPFAPKNYKGQMIDENYDYSLELIFITPRNFVLHEEITLPNGKVNKESRTGVWHKILDGTIVQLTDNQGYYKLLNVGAKGNFYIGCQLPSGIQRTVTLLSQDCEQEISFSLAGILCLSEEKAWLQDTKGDLIYPLEYSKVKDFYKNNPTLQEMLHVVKLEVSLLTKKSSQYALQIKKIESRAIIQRHVVQANTVHFLELMTGYRWVLVKSGEEKLKLRYIFEFDDAKTLNGAGLNVFSAFDNVSGLYTTDNDNIKFTFQRLMLNNVETKYIIQKLEKVVSIRMYGVVLELWDDINCLLTLEKNTKYQKIKKKPF